MEIDLYQVDAFTTKLFGGNPAAVCPLEKWLDDETLQKVSLENNLSETAFFVKEREGVYKLRWFTPTVEVDLCGHATLASAYVIFNVLHEPVNQITFSTQSGDLIVTQEQGVIVLNFPSYMPKKVKIEKKLLKAVSFEPKEIYFNKKLLFLLRDEREVINAVPNFETIRSYDGDGLIITAAGDKVDFVSRYFAPHAGIPEDPVTGSAHTLLTPFWSERLNKKVLTAKQVSSRGGELLCENLDGRVKISGNAVLYSKGKIYL